MDIKEVRKCCRCGQAKPLVDFRRDSRDPLGRQRRCRECASAYERLYRQTEHGRKACGRAQKKYRRRPEIRAKFQFDGLMYAKLHRKANSASTRVSYAVAAGKLIRPPTCSKCGKSCVADGHHENYARPLSVTWLCRACHRFLHEKKNKRIFLQC